MPSEPAALRRAAGWLAGLLIASFLGAASADYGDIVFPRKPGLGDEYPPATFPHYVHRMQFRCYACHDDIFKMSPELNGISMETIQGGRHCGKCHDGTTAFQATFETCPRCHLR